MTRPMQGVIRHLRRAVLVRDGAGLTDGQLLALFIEQRDEAAFEALVRRHGSMVMGVCRRILHNPHDAEDAFQATFLVLVRKAASIVPREKVANWLYGVARTTALRANALTAKRRMRERQVREMPEPEVLPPSLWHDLQPLLDQELSRLPDKYRIAIVLCDLEGKSHQEAARQLGWPQGTVSGRLARGRKLLADRLARHGLCVSSGVLACVLSQEASSASVPASLVSSTVKAASALAAGQAAVAGLISIKAAALTEGVVITMLLNKLKMVTMALIIGAMVAGAGLFYRTQAAGPAEESPRAVASQTEKEVPPPDRDVEREASEQNSRNLLSSSPMPRQALVSLEKGQLVVRTLDVMYEPTSIVFEGRAHTSYQKAEILKTKHYATEMVKVYDVSGKSINKKELPRLLKKETVALVSTGVEASDPLNLRLFKEGTLLFVVPSPPAPAAGVAYFPAQPPVTYGSPVPPPAVGESRIAPSLTPPLPRTAANADSDVCEVHTPVVLIPLAKMMGYEERAASKRLYWFASTDTGKTWDMVGTIPPGENSFVFHAPKDGMYWLIVRTLRREGKAEPSDLTGTLRPQLKLLVNTGNSR